MFSPGGGCEVGQVCGTCGRVRNAPDESGWYRKDGVDFCPLHPPNAKQEPLFLSP